MGTRYSLHLYFPIRKLECAIENIVSLAEASTENRMSIWLPNGNKLVVPQASSVVDKESRRLDKSSSSVSFRTVFLFSVDSIIENYLRGIEEQPIDTSIKHRIGFFHVTIKVGDSFSEITINTVSSSQNDMLAKSPVVHQTMQNVLKACDGLFGLIDTKTDGDKYECLLLSDTTKRISIEIDESQYGSDVDYIVAIIQQQT